MSKTVPFQTIQFSIIQFSSIWPIDRTLSGTTPLSQSGLGAMAMKRYSAFPKALAFLEIYHEIVYCHTQDTRWQGPTPLQRTVVIFYSPVRLGKASNEILIENFAAYWDEILWSYSFIPLLLLSHQSVHH